MPTGAQLFQMLSGIGDTAATGITAASKAGALQALGSQIQSGDLTGATRTAFANGDLTTGLALLKQAQSQKGNAAFDSLLGTSGLLGGSPGAASASSGSTAAPASAPRTMQMPADPEIENRFISTLKQGGLTNPNGLAAVAAYANAESRYSPQNITGSWSDPSQSGQPGASGGILSWRGDRLANMRQMTAGAPDPVEAQAKFMLTENPDLTVALQNAKSPEEAHTLMANAWRFAGFDQPGGENARRLALTQSYLGHVGGGATPQQQVASGQPSAAPTGSPDPGVARSIALAAQYHPDQPASQVLAPAVVAANPAMYAGTVSEVAARLGGGSAPPAGPVRTASADPNFMPATSPAAATPGQVLVSQAAARPGAAPIPLNPDPLVVVPGINGGRPINKAWVAAQPDGADVPDDGVLERLQGTGGAAATSAQTLPQISATAPQVLAQAGAPAALSQAIASTTDPSRRAQILIRAALIPGLDEGRKGIIKTLLANELKQTDQPDAVKQYNFARAQGETRTFTEWQDRNQSEKSYTTLITPEQRARYGVPAEYKGSVQVDASGKLAYPGKASTEVNVNQSSEKAQDSKIGGAYGDTFNELQKGGRDAQGQLNTFRIMEKLIDSPDFYSGPQSAGMLALKRGAAVLGVKGADAAAPQEVFQKLSQQSVLDKLGGSLGAGVSNADVTFMSGTTANLQNTPEGNRQVIQFGKALAQRQIEVSKLSRKYAQEHNGRLDSGFDDVLSEYAEAHPLFPEQTRAQQQRAVGGAPTPTSARAPAAPSRALSPDDAAQSLANARAAVAKNPAARAQVLQRLQDAGIDASGL